MTAAEILRRYPDAIYAGPDECVNKAIDALRKCEAYNARLQDALAWYADESFYDNGEAWQDGGNKARTTLQEVEG